MILQHEQSQVNFTREAVCCEPLAKVLFDFILAFQNTTWSMVSIHDMEDLDFVHRLNSSVTPKGLPRIYCPFTQIPNLSPTLPRVPGHTHTAARPLSRHTSKNGNLQSYQAPGLIYDRHINLSCGEQISSLSLPN